MRIRSLTVAAVVVSCVASTFSQTPPQTPERPVVDKHYGITVVDPYRWLENWQDPQVRTWTDAQNQYMRALLDAQSFTEPVRQRVKAVGSSANPRWTALKSRPGALFALKFQPPLNQPLLVVMPPSADPASERVIVDPNRIDPSGGTTIDFYVPSRDGRLAAVSLSVGGTEDGTLHIFDVATGQELPDTIPRVNGGTAGGSAVWDTDSKGLFYTRYPHDQERPAADYDFYQQVYFHKLGTPVDADTYALGRDFPRIAETQLESSADGKYLLAKVANGDGGDFAHYIRGPDGSWRRIAAFEDQVHAIAAGPDNMLYALSHKNAPHGAVVKVAPTAPSVARGRTIYRATEGDITQIVASSDRLLVSRVMGGPHELHVMNLNGEADRRVSIPPLSAVSQLVVTEQGALFLMERWVEPPAWYRVGAGDTIVRTSLGVRSNVDFSDIVAERAQATSRDGTSVPLTILHRKDVRLNGANPTLLYGYGGYGINRSPQFSATQIVWFEQGGVYAVANLRGGGEFGDEWHRAGKLTRKQNVFDDFAACAKLLVERGYTNPAKLAIQGGSNGGLLMGAVLTQHPDLARAVVSTVGVYDMLRSELWSNGAFNVTEFGTVKDRKQFDALYAYSPYEHVVKGTPYPAILLVSGTSDPRVNPGDSRRFAARLQSATSSGRPVLLRVSSAGHVGTALSGGLAQAADIYTFLFWQLGVDYRAPKGDTAP